MVERPSWNLRLVAAGFLLVLTLSGSAKPSAATLEGCPVFPSDHIWNVRVDKLPVDPRSSDYIATIGAATGLHPDFGAGSWNGAPIGIPYTTVPGTQALVPMHWTAYGNESDPGPYPIPGNAPIEGGPSSTGDRHVLVEDRDHCKLYELYRAFPQVDGSWNADAGAIYDLRTYALRPDTWTSADAAGLPILPGLARYDEVAAGEIKHALRFTAANTRMQHIWPARHDASSSTNPNYPPMGQRFRLKAAFDITGFSPQVRVLLTGLKAYGLILADNGSNWYVSGTPNFGWNDGQLVSELASVHGSDFEALDESGLMLDPNSGRARLTANPLYLPAMLR